NTAHGSLWRVSWCPAARSASYKFPIRSQRGLRAGAPTKAFEPFMALRNEPLPDRLVLIEGHESLSNGPVICWRDQERSRARHLRHGTDTGGDEGRTDRHGLDERQAKPFMIRGV